MEKHTPGPWFLGAPDSNGQAVVHGPHFEIATCWHHSVGNIEKEMHANAAFIVRAANSFDEMLAALEAHQDWADKESAGPQYPPGITRDTPGGEDIWRAWWEEQLELSERAQRLTRAALSRARQPGEGEGR